MKETDERLRLSLTGGSGIAASCVLECPRKHYFKYELSWKLKKMSKPFAFGILLHDSFFTQNFNIFKRAWQEGKLIDSKTEDEQLSIIIDREPNDIHKDVCLAMMMYTTLGQQKIKFKDTERYLKTPILNPENGETPSHLEGVFVSGKRDMIEDTDEGESISDLKTAKTEWKEGDLLGSIQLRCYRYLEACEGDQLHNLGHYLIITKHKVPRFQRLKQCMDDSDHFYVYEHFKMAAETILRNRKSGEWPRNCSSCNGKFGQLCDFHPLCFPHMYSDASAAANKVLEIR